MNNIRAIFFLLIYLGGVVIPACLTREAVKIPALVQHYYKYRGGNPDQTLFNFLAQHYGQQFNRHQTAHDHSGLPGKGAHDASSPSALLALPAEAPLWLLQTPFVPHKISWNSGDDLFSGRYLADIWQPPKA